MRIIVNGQQAFGADVLRALLERDRDEVAAVYCAPERPGAGPDPLRRAAEAAGLPVLQPTSFEAPQVAEQMRAHEADLMVMAFVTLFVPEAVLRTPRLGSIQYHPSLLPRHRGPSAINWAILHGDPTTGVCIFWPDEGLDTGPVLLSREVVIGPDDTVGSLYFDKLYPLGLQAMREAIDLVAAGEAPREAQDESRATYETWCRPADVAIDWHRPASEVYARARGGDPRPGANAPLDGLTVSFFDASPGGRRPEGARPGEVISIDEDGVVVAASDGCLRFGRVRAGDGPKQPAGAFACDSGLAPGDVFGSARPDA